MRLIDADEVKKAFIGNRYGTKAIEYVIDNAPTVEAIPIEWIVQYQNKHQLYGVCDEDYIILDNMLCAWEAENEI